MTLFAALDLRPASEGRWEADHAESGGDVVFGGQILAQALVAATRSISEKSGPDKEVRSLHAVFARGASTALPLQLDVEVMHSGRAFASATVTVCQDDRLCARTLVLLDAAEPDLIRHAPRMPDVEGPSATEMRTPNGPWWEIGAVGGVDISDPNAVGPAELCVWTRFPGAPDDPTSSRAALAYATDGFLIGTAMRPHAGVGQALAHVSISTTVLTHTLSFHEPFHAGEWLLLAHESPYAGRGRSYGRAHVFTEDGRLVASCVQDNMIRDFPTGQRPAPGDTVRF